MSFCFFDNNSNSSSGSDDEKEEIVEIPPCNCSPYNVYFEEEPCNSSDFKKLFLINGPFLIISDDCREIELFSQQYNLIRESVFNGTFYNHLSTAQKEILKPIHWINKQQNEKTVFIYNDQGFGNDKDKYSVKHRQYGNVYVDNNPHVDTYFTFVRCDKRLKPFIEEHLGFWWKIYEYSDLNFDQKNDLEDFVDQYLIEKKVHNLSHDFIVVRIPRAGMFMETIELTGIEGCLHFHIPKPEVLSVKDTILEDYKGTYGPYGYKFFRSLLPKDVSDEEEKMIKQVLQIGQLRAVLAEDYFRPYKISGIFFGFTFNPSLCIVPQGIDNNHSYFSFKKHPFTKRDDCEVIPFPENGECGNTINVSEALYLADLPSAVAATCFRLAYQSYKKSKEESEKLQFKTLSPWKYKQSEYFPLHSFLHYCTK